MPRTVCPRTGTGTGTYTISLRPRTGTGTGTGTVPQCTREEQAREGLLLNEGTFNQSSCFDVVVHAGEVGGEEVRGLGFEPTCLDLLFLEQEDSTIQAFVAQLTQKELNLMSHNTPGNKKMLGSEHSKEGDDQGGTGSALVLCAVSNVSAFELIPACH